MQERARPEIAVVVPLVDIRSGMTSCLRTWTHEQTLDRYRYQVVVASNGEWPELEHEAAGLLVPHDVLERFQDAPEDSLWQHGASLAGAPWLLLTEAHCLADEACLEAALRAIEEIPDLDAAVLGCDHAAEGIYEDLFPRWFDEHIEVWSTREWTQLVAYGFVIRADVFAAAGGLEPRYGLACALVLSARLHDEGRNLGTLPGARIKHIHNDRLADHHENSVSHARGECEARLDFDPAFCERYFGYQPIWGNQMRYQPQLARHVGRSLLRLRTSAREPRPAGWFLRELASWAPAALAGTRAQRVYERLASAACTQAAERLPLPRSARYAAFLNAQEHVVRLAHLQWVADHRRRLPGVVVKNKRWPVEQLTPELLTGVHGLEQYLGRTFRWTEPIVLFRLAAVGHGSVVTIDTGGLRGPPARYVIGVVAGDARVDRAQLSGDDERLRIQLSATESEAARSSGLLIICDPLLPARLGSSDSRRLGMPVFSLELTSTSADGHA